MYYPDLTPYCYFKSASSDGALNIGWLDNRNPFPTKRASETLLDALFERCLLYSVIQTRGFHVCELCDSPKHEPMKVFRHGQENSLGSAEIRVKGKDGRVYAAPTLIYHYVAAHDYDPPKEFVEALLADEDRSDF